VLRWHRNLLARRHAARSRPKCLGRPRTVHSIRQLVLRLAAENPCWGYRRIHGELPVLGIKVAASTVREILQQAGIDPAPERTTATWASFLRSQAGALLACDFFETVTLTGSGALYGERRRSVTCSVQQGHGHTRHVTTLLSVHPCPQDICSSGQRSQPVTTPHKVRQSPLTGTRLHVLAVIEHATRRIRILGAIPHPTASWVVQAARNLVMDLEDAGSQARFLIRDRDGKFVGVFDTVLQDAGIERVLSGVQMPRMNSIMERWVQTCRHELLDRTLMWNQRHLLHALREFEHFYNEHRPHRTLRAAAPLRPLPGPIADPERIAHLDVRRRDRLGGILHEYRHAA
jgi:transposase InsO family protein